MEHDSRIRLADLRVASLIGVSFLLGSTCWLVWLNRLMAMVPPAAVDVFTLVVGYAVQAVGMGVYLLVGERLGERRLRRATLACVAASVLCGICVAHTSVLAAVAVFGFAANVATGFVAGFYAHVLCCCVEAGARARVFGCAYATSTLVSWLLSLPGDAALLEGVPASCVLAVLACVVGWCVGTQPWDAAPSGEDAPNTKTVYSREPDKTVVALAATTVVLASLVKNLGYGFPTQDLIQGVSVELTRLLYGAGLVVAGFLADKDRRLGALCCMAALATPFFMLALAGNEASGTLLWSLDYFLFGFFSMYRTILLCDLAERADRPALAVLGLALGKTGDAVGSAMCLGLGTVPLVLVSVTGIVFALAMASFFALYQSLYVPQLQEGEDEARVFERFAARHDLSLREREVLELLLDGRTNIQIASALFVSESTVKFHVRNVLRKTGCRNRRDLIAAYAGVKTS